MTILKKGLLITEFTKCHVFHRNIHLMQSPQVLPFPIFQPGLIFYDHMIFHTPLYYTSPFQKNCLTGKIDDCFKDVF